MSQATDRLRNLLAEELDGCCAADVDDRLAALEDLAASADLERVEADADVFATLGNPTRQRLVRLLAAADGELCVCELTPLVDVSDSAISHALADLSGAGLVERRKEGKWRYYRTTERAERLLAAVDETPEDR